MHGHHFAAEISDALLEAQAQSNEYRRIVGVDMDPPPPPPPSMQGRSGIGFIGMTPTRYIDAICVTSAHSLREIYGHVYSIRICSFTSAAYIGARNDRTYGYCLEQERITKTSTVQETDLSDQVRLRLCSPAITHTGCMSSVHIAEPPIRWYLQVIQAWIRTRRGTPRTILEQSLNRCRQHRHRCQWATLCRWGCLCR